MTRLQAIWNSETTQSRRLLVGAAACVVVGALVIIVGAIAGWDWTRVIGATLISVGGVGLGILVGFVAARPRQPEPQAAAWRTIVAVVAAVVLVLPVVAALLAALVGLFAGGNRNAGLLVLGAVIALVLLAVTILSTAIAVQATRRATNTIRPAQRAAAEEA